jgi:hypothetical protein
MHAPFMRAFMRAAALRLCRDRGRPYGDAPWVARTAARLGIESSLRPRGQPPKSTKEDNNVESRGGAVA